MAQLFNLITEFWKENATAGDPEKKGKKVSWLMYSSWTDFFPE